MSEHYEEELVYEKYAQQAARGQRVSREKAVYRYTTALTSGDIETLIAVLEEAEHDSTLEQMVLETHQAYQVEEHTIPQAEEIEQVRALLFAPPPVQQIPRQKSNGSFAHRSTRLLQLGAFARALAAVLIVGVLLGSYLALFAFHHTQSGLSTSSTASVTWKGFPVQVPASSSNNLNSVAVVSTNDAWAVGCYSSGKSGGSIVEHWNGRAWSRVNDPVPACLFSVAAVSSNDIWAVGFTTSSSDVTAMQTLVERWNGSAWTAVKSPNSQQHFNVLYSVAALSSTNIWAVGNSYSVFSNVAARNARPLIEHWDGQQWSLVTATFPATYSALYQIKALSASDIWAVGATFASGENDSSQALIEHWDGTRWNAVSSPHPGASRSFLYAVTAVSADDLWAVGTIYGKDLKTHTLIEQWNGRQWSIVGSPDPGVAQNYLFAVTARSSSDIWAAGYFSNSSASNASSKASLQTLVVHWDGKQWSVVKSPNAQFSDIWIGAVASDTRSGAIWMVGFSSDQSSRMTSHIVLLR